MEFSAFTYTWPSIVNSMTTTVFLHAGNESMEVNALWDTGATSTCISQKCVEALGLISTGKAQSYTAGGLTNCNTFLLDVELPNRVRVKDVTVRDAQIGQLGYDVLIGMDIISNGDFSVSNFGGQTVMSYRHPSKRTTDYVKIIEAEKNQAAIGHHGKGKRKHR